LALWTSRRVGTVKALLFIGAQLLGGLAAYSLFKYFSRGQVQQLPTAYDSHILVAEAVGAFVFAFVAAGAMFQRLHPMVRAAVTGGAFTMGVIIASAASAGFINPAIALANNAWAWGTYVLGPVLGAVIGVNLYGLLFNPKLDGKTGFVKSAKTSVVERHIEEDRKAVPADRLEKVERAEKVAKADKARKNGKKKK
jgi:glycerol uptake facilitator-like aquaporin